MATISSKILLISMCRGDFHLRPGFQENCPSLFNIFFLRNIIDIHGAFLGAYSIRHIQLLMTGKPDIIDPLFIFLFLLLSQKDQGVS